MSNSPKATDRHPMVREAVEDDGCLMGRVSLKVQGPLAARIGLCDSIDDAFCEPSSLEVLYCRHAGELRRIFFARCRDHELAADAVQEVFLRLQRVGLENAREPRAWLVRVGYNWLTDQIRRRRRRAALTGDLIHVLSHDDPADSTRLREDREVVQDSIRQLKESDQNLLALRYSMNWNAARIALHLGINPDAVDMRLTRARRRLASIIARQWPMFHCAWSVT